METTAHNGSTETSCFMESHPSDGNAFSTADADNGEKSIESDPERTAISEAINSNSRKFLTKEDVIRFLGEDVRSEVVTAETLKQQVPSRG